jgi:hypothetical protein
VISPVHQEYKVDLVLWGHHHLYHRSCPVYQEVCLDHGTVHVLVAMGGHDLSDNVEPSNPAWLEYLDYKVKHLVKCGLPPKPMIFFHSAVAHVSIPAFPFLVSPTLKSYVTYGVIRVISLTLSTGE